MRPVLASVLVLLALPATASAQSTLPPLDYAAPTASISRGAPLTFAVRTARPGGSVVVRVSGSDDGRRRRPADRPRGHLARRDRHAGARRPAGLERPRELGAAPAPRPLLLAGLPDRRGGRRRRGADRPRPGADRHGSRWPIAAAASCSRATGAAAAARASTSPPPTSPARSTASRFKKLAKATAVALGPEGAALDERQGRRPGRLQRRRLLDRRRRRCARRADRLRQARQGRRERPRAARRGELGAGPGLSGARRGRPRERAAARARSHGRQQEASRALHELADDRGARRRRVVARGARQVVRRLLDAAPARPRCASCSCTASCASTSAAG